MYLISMLCQVYVTRCTGLASMLFVHIFFAHNWGVCYEIMPIGGALTVNVVFVNCFYPAGHIKKWHKYCFYLCDWFFVTNPIL